MFGGFGNKVFGKLHVGRRRFLVRNLRERSAPAFVPMRTMKW